MATAYVKDTAIRFFREPDLNTEVTMLTRKNQFEPHYLTNFGQNDYLGAIQGRQGNFTKILYEFRIRMWVYIFLLPPSQRWESHTETLWVLTEDITTDSPEVIQAEEEEAQADAQQAERDKILAEINSPTTSSKTLTAQSSNQSSSGGMIAAIVAALAILIGVLVWALGRKKQPVLTLLPAPTLKKSNAGSQEVAVTK